MLIRQLFSHLFQRRTNRLNVNASTASRDTKVKDMGSPASSKSALETASQRPVSRPLPCKAHFNRDVTACPQSNMNYVPIKPRRQRAFHNVRTPKRSHLAKFVSQKNLCNIWESWDGFAPDQEVGEC